MNSIDEFCRVADSMAMVQSFCFEHRYDIIEEEIVNVLTMIFAPEICYTGERLLKAEFFGVCEFESGDLFRLIFPPLVSIEDISYRGLENIHYLVKEAEDHFSFMCDRIEFEITEGMIK